jgi:hypothetical protein
MPRQVKSTVARTFAMAYIVGMRVRRGSTGGLARAAKLSANELSRQAQYAVKARWANASVADRRSVGKMLAEARARKRAARGVEES